MRLSTIPEHKCPDTRHVADVFASTVQQRHEVVSLPPVAVQELRRERKGLQTWPYPRPVAVVKEVPSIDQERNRNVLQFESLRRQDCRETFLGFQQIVPKDGDWRFRKPIVEFIRVLEYN